MRPRSPIVYAGLLLLAACTCQAQDAKALVEAGRVKLDAGDWKGGIEDMTRAIELDPANPLAYKCRALGKHMLLDFDGAMADLDKAVELDSGFYMAWNDRANVRMCKGDFAGCVADCDRAIGINPDFDFAYINRAYGKFLLDDLDGASADFLMALELKTKVGDYPNLWLWVIRARGGKQAEADAALRAYLKARAQPTDWVTIIGAFLLGEVKEEDLLQAVEGTMNADKPLYLCEALYYAGLKRFLGGDLEGAADLYQRCLATGRTDYVEYQASKVALASLARPVK